jgi:hypothetical protein
VLDLRYATPTGTDYIMSSPVKKYLSSLGRSMSCEFTSSLPVVSAGSIRGCEPNYLFPSLSVPSNGGSLWEMGDVSGGNDLHKLVAPDSVCHSRAEGGYPSMNVPGLQLAPTFYDASPRVYDASPRVMDDLEVSYQHSADPAITPRSECGELFMAVNSNSRASHGVRSRSIHTSLPPPLPPLHFVSATGSCASSTVAATATGVSSRRSSLGSERSTVSGMTSQSPCSFRRDRSCSLPDTAEMDCFIQLDATWSSSLCDDVEPAYARYLQHHHVLSVLISKADAGMKRGVEPVMADGGLGGTYFLKDSVRNACIVCKPGDEEPNGPWNPHNTRTAKWAAYKGRIIPGFGMYREVATYLLNAGFVGVPPTALARVRHRLFRSNSILKSKPVPASARLSPSTTAAVFSMSKCCELCANKTRSTPSSKSLLDPSDYSSGVVNGSRTPSCSCACHRVGPYEIPKQRGVHWIVMNRV